MKKYDIHIRIGDSHFGVEDIALKKKDAEALIQVSRMFNDWMDIDRIWIGIDEVYTPIQDFCIALG